MASTLFEAFAAAVHRLQPTAPHCVERLQPEVHTDEGIPYYFCRIFLRDQELPVLTEGNSSAALEYYATHEFLSTLPSQPSIQPTHATH